MDDRLMSAEDLHKVTGYTQTSAQLRWFNREYGFKPVVNTRGIVITWQTFHELDKRRAGLSQQQIAYDRPALRLA